MHLRYEYHEELGLGRKWQNFAVPGCGHLEYTAIIVPASYISMVYIFTSG